MSKPILDQKLAMKVARENDFQVVRGGPRRLLLDLDTAEALDIYEDNLVIVQEDLDVVELERWESKNGGWHVKLRLSVKMSILERALLQAILGSDLTREWYSLLRLWSGKTKEPHLLFRPKKKMHKNEMESSRLSDDDIPF